MFEAATNNAIHFKILSELLHNIFYDVYLEITADGISARMIDINSNILVDIEFPIKFFTQYKASRPCYIKFNAANFYEAFSSIKRGDNLVLSIKEDALLKMFITATPRDRDYISKSYITIHEVAPVAIALPAGYSNQPIHVPSVQFQKVCKLMNKMGKEHVIKYSPQSLIFTGETENIFGKEFIFGNYNAEDELVEELYDVEHFLKISKISSFNKMLYFYPLVNNPLLINVPIAGVGKIDIYIKSETLTNGIPDGLP